MTNSIRRAETSDQPGTPKGCSLTAAVRNALSAATRRKGRPHGVCLSLRLGGISGIIKITNLRRERAMIRLEKIDAGNVWEICALQVAEYIDEFQ